MIPIKLAIIEYPIDKEKLNKNIAPKIACPANQRKTVDAICLVLFSSSAILYKHLFRQYRDIYPEKKLKTKNMINIISIEKLTEKKKVIKHKI